MKKFFLSVVTILSISLVSNAQFKVGIKAGINDNDQRIKVTEGSIYGGDKFKGYHAGLVGDLNLGKNFYLQPQLLFTRKGAIHLSSTGAEDMKIKMNYVEMPLNVLYKIDLPFGKVFGGTGVTLSYAVGGKQEQDGVTKKLYSNTGNNWRREDISLNFTAGLEFNNGLFVSANSQKGLRNVYKAGADIKNRSMSVSVGYLIDWNKFKRKA
ncbi:porin family protein [Terrimonas pollutisoli]|uniref:porin family protein n=1 Tax=Terrimonas pollutisoli TaxID=3034147 RepID=UPI0023ED2814|nr:porin family protein [Terrimonas sp. H1YJ31]